MGAEGKEAVAGHTPGPWFVQPGYRSIYALSHGTTGLTIFITKPEGHQCGEEQADANARLIAAAPDLLAALRFYVEIEERCLANKPVPTLELDQCLESARAAIAKAEPLTEGADQ